ncbi:hypothetical protein IU11_15930 [Cellulosimicrobium sp. MM]|nr:hypothetical protein IU11_15930 [Cellulosimicrobium sp. MM]
MCQAHLSVTDRENLTTSRRGSGQPSAAKLDASGEAVLPSGDLDGSGRGAPDRRSHPRGAHPE